MARSNGQGPGGSLIKSGLAAAAMAPSLRTAQAVIGNPTGLGVKRATVVVTDIPAGLHDVGETVGAS